MSRTGKLLEEYEKRLYNKKLVPAYQVKYFVGWVRRYLVFSDALGDELVERRIELYEQKINTEGWKDWQIRQALDAVKLFYQQN